MKNKNCYLIFAGLLCLSISVAAQNPAAEEKIYFEPSAYHISAGQGLGLSKYKEKVSTIKIEACTDDVGSLAENEALARKRAETVKDFLQKEGFKPEMIEILAPRILKLKNTENTEAIRRENRRVSLFFYEGSGNLEQFIAEQRRKAQQNFVIEADEASEVLGKKGTLLLIPAATFVYPDGTPAKGKVQIRLTEAYNYGDMILQNLATVSDGRLLETGGMFHIAATDESGKELKAERRIMAYMPTEGAKLPGMQGFWGGNPDPHASVNWSEGGDSVKFFRFDTRIDVTRRLDMQEFEKDIAEFTRFPILTAWPETEKKISKKQRDSMTTIMDNLRKICDGGSYNKYVNAFRLNLVLFSFSEEDITSLVNNCKDLNANAKNNIDKDTEAFTEILTEIKDLETKLEALLKNAKALYALDISASFKVSGALIYGAEEPDFFQHSAEVEAWKKLLEGDEKLSKRNLKNMQKLCEKVLKAFKQEELAKNRIAFLKAFKKNKKTLQTYIDLSNAHLDLKLKMDTLMARLGLLSTAEITNMYGNAMNFNALGWINCDRFLTLKNKTDLEIVVDKDENTSVYLIFDEIKSLMRAERGANGIFVLKAVPSGMKARVLGIRVNGQSAEVFSQETVLGQSGTLRPNFQTKTLEELTAWTKAL